MMRWTLLLISLSLGCASAPQLPALTRDREAESLERAVAWPHASPRAIMVLASVYLARNRVREGYATFEARAKADPAQPLFLALSGLFQARLANEVALLQRVAWVEDAAGKLDRAAARGGLERYLRGIVFAELPARFARAQTAASDLEWMLAQRASFPPGLRRGAWRGLGKAYTTLGHKAEADAAFANAEDGHAPPTLIDGSVSEAGGYRFAPRELVEVTKDVVIARGFDFAEIGFVTTRDGVIAIDAGTTPETAAAALAAFRQREQAPIKYVLITHSHWDHIGGLPALVGPGTQVVARCNFEDELARVNATKPPFHYFFGTGATGPFQLAPTHCVSAREELEIGGTHIILEPTRGGETDDALLVQLSDEGILFVGDAFMPYFGAPFVAEGSVEGLLETIGQLRALAPKLLIHGHAPLTINFPVEIMPALGEAVARTREVTLEDIRNARTETETLSRAMLPEALTAQPEAVVPFLLMRDHLISRMYRQRAGYWSSDGSGMEVFDTKEQASAFDLVAGGREEAFTRAAESLNARGDFGMSLRIAEIGLAAHPSSRPLSTQKQRALEGLRERHQFDPFKFLIYSEMAHDEVAEVK